MVSMPVCGSELPTHWQLESKTSSVGYVRDLLQHSVETVQNVPDKEKQTAWFYIFSDFPFNMISYIG